MLLFDFIKWFGDLSDNKYLKALALLLLIIGLAKASIKNYRAIMAYRNANHGKFFWYQIVTYSIGVGVIAPTIIIVYLCTTQHTFWWWILLIIAIYLSIYFIYFAKMVLGIWFGVKAFTRVLLEKPIEKNETKKRQGISN
jgi:hypothetical protein